MELKGEFIKHYIPNNGVCSQFRQVDGYRKNNGTKGRFLKFFFS